MDGYVPAYVAHNVPLLVVSGLGSHPKNAARKDGGVRITSEIPPVESEDAQTLLRYFKENDASGLAWNQREHTGKNKFMVKTVGRDYNFPPRHASALAASLGISPTSRPILHSALSPLSPGSSLYPDGLLDSRWIEKHQEHVPSAFVSFYMFTSDPKLSTLHDNQLKTDINNTKSILGQSGYKTRQVVALLSEKSIVQSPEVEERLANIRRATGLDLKTSLFFLPPQSSQVELSAFVKTITSTIYPLSIEYYRELSKHSRRKRNRGVVPAPTAPPTSGTSQTLSSQGWNVRYDFKLGVFAEFRQEMDAAIRSYESGYEALLGPDVLETIASWNPRWNEARLLADVFAIRILRCLLWNGNPTAAVRRWQLHRERIRDFVDRRGKGSSTYGWEAWESRWAMVMAEMIEKVSTLDFGGPTVCLPAEKSIAVGERLQPWEYLHHPGYWFHEAAKHLIARRAFALAIPEEDRSAPVAVDAPGVATKSSAYDTYLCPHPHEEYPLPGNEGINHSMLIIECLEKAMAEFQQRNQYRQVQVLKLLSANESMRCEAWNEALHILRPLWQNMTYRKEGWWNAAEEIAWALRNAAAHTGDGGSVVSVDWEMLNRNFTHQSDWHYDLNKSLEGVASVNTKPSVVLNNKDVHSFLSASYSFEHGEGKVGETSASQLVVTSTAFQSSTPVSMAEIRIEFEGSMKPLVLKHNGKREDIPKGALSWSHIPLKDFTHSGRPALLGECDLTFPPGQIRVFEFSSLLREAGDAKAAFAAFSMSMDLFDLEYIHNFETTSTPQVWWASQLAKRRVTRTSAASINVLPKPPKMELRFLDSKALYYTNEQIKLKLEVINGEDVDSIANLDIRFLGDEAPNMTFSVPTEPLENEEDSEVLGRSLGRIASGESMIIEIFIASIDLPAIYDLSTRTSYTLTTDTKTLIYRSMTIQLEVINPFEANYDFSPRIHPDSWPSFFTHKERDSAEDAQEVTAHGLAQKWCLSARYASFATEDLIVEDLDVEVLGSNGGIESSARKVTNLPIGGLRVAPKSLEEAQFDTFTQKLSLDDRGTATIDISFAIKWRRDGTDTPLNTTVLAVPRLLVSSSEPRVLAAVSYSTTMASMIHFDVTIENPSNHFLTFSLTMEPSEKFAFSGTKQSTLQLVPLSRRSMHFRLLPNVRGEWIGPINCVIRDRYFQKVLKIMPMEGLRIDKEGLMVWSPPEDEL